jgi:hypothetical protein
MKKFLSKYACLYPNWDEKSCEQWKKQYTSGLMQFVIKEGVLTYGVIFFICFMLFKIGTDTVTSSSIQITASLWLGGAVIYGLGMWYGTLYSYKNRKNGFTKPRISKQNVL